MKKLLMNTTKLAAIMLALGLITGCAYNTRIQTAQNTAEAAQRAADAAQAAADAATEKADQALREAAQARQAAGKCSARCDRMFQKSQAK